MTTTVIKTCKDSGGDYSSPSQFDAGEARDLVALDEIAVLEIYPKDSGAAWDDQIKIDDGSWNTDSDHPIIITVPLAYRHRGEDDTGVSITYSTADHIFILEVDNVKVEWLEVYDATGSSSAAFRVDSDNCYIEHCIIRDDGTSDADGDGILIRSDDLSTYISNCVIHDINRSAILNQSSERCSTYVYHCTCYNCCKNNTNSRYPGIGFDTSLKNTDAEFIIYNTYVSVNDTSTNDCFQEGGAIPADEGHITTMENCASNDDTADDFGGTGHLVNIAPGSQFVSLGDDLHLKAGSSLIEAGTSVPAYSIDIDGADRNILDVWDIGADMYNQKRTRNDFFPFFTGR